MQEKLFPILKEKENRRIKINQVYLKTIGFLKLHKWMIYFYRYIRTQRQVSATEPPLAQFEWEGVNQNGKSCGIWKLFKKKAQSLCF